MFSVRRRQFWPGALVTHLNLFIRDVAADATSHNLWPLEFLFWGIVAAAQPMAERSWRTQPADAARAAARFEDQSTFVPGALSSNTESAIGLPEKPSSFHRATT